MLVRYIFLFIFLFSSYSQLLAQLADRMYADSIHAPFYYGVASGDPMPDRVIIWTRISPSGSMGAVSVNYEIAADDNFTQVISSGSLSTDFSYDFTVRYDATGLQPNTTYYYRFHDGDGNYSAIGRTKTAPTGDINSFKMAVVSCSSIFSGYFNAYRQISLRSDLNLVVHLGDYVYDFVDPDEEVRVPQPYPGNPNTLPEWRERQKLYLLDPDLRELRRMHPMMIMWDNHDMAGDDEITLQAFYEYTPTRQVRSDWKRNYRRLTFGDLVDITLLDILLFRNQDELEPGEFSVLGNQQYEWFIDQLDSVNTKWKVIGSQKIFSYWGVQSLGNSIGENGVLNQGTWDGFQLERKNVLEYIRDKGIDNVVMISGDSHLSLATDLAVDPLNPSDYNGETGEGGLGVELCPTSVTRGNFDELGLPPSLLEAIYNLSYSENPHHLFEELVSHGYGLLEFDEDSMKASIRYCPILSVSNLDTLGFSGIMYNGINHWKREGDIYVRPLGYSPPLPTGVKISNPYPNPANTQVSMDLTLPSNEKVTVSMYDFRHWKNMKTIHTQQTSEQSSGRITFDTSTLKPGRYLIQVVGKNINVVRVFVKI